MKKVLKRGLILLVLSLCLTGCESEEEQVQKELENKGAAESSALGYIDAVEKQIMLAQVDTAAMEIEYPGTYTVSELDDYGVSIRGEKPKSTGIVTINKIGAVEDASLEFEDYKVHYNGSEALATKK